MNITKIRQDQASNQNLKIQGYNVMNFHSRSVEIFLLTLIKLLSIHNALASSVRIATLVK